ncbi:hypothetical protein [Virgibacillus litoralis]|uniref:DUF4129 domain-containing protein n=1 Tax=Virgibacillus litoralis TaxID=578221 RepID=A0ABS4HHL8_9BACI|nr:hypothetical protein [Virgibacillus litoralis]MBP1950099.1 hypothetical protein [Virgibacillus litoralis]
MDNSNRIVKFIQLFSESIMFYFILIPIFIFTQNPYPLWSYLLITGLTLILFDICLRIIKNYAVYVPVIAIAFSFMYYIFNYPILAIALWLGFITWRYAHTERNGPSENQFTILTLTIVMFFLEIMFINHPNLIWFGILQFIIILCGYWLKLMNNMESHGKLKTTLTFSTFGILLLAGGIFTYGIYPWVKGVIRFILSGVGILFQYIVFGIVNIADFLGLDFGVLLNLVDEKTFNQATSSFKENMDEMDGMANIDSSYDGGIDFINWWTILIALALLIVIAIFLSRKKVIQESFPDGKKSSISIVTPLRSSSDSNNGLRKYFSPWKTVDPLRRKVLKLEQKAYTNGLGRQSSETIEEWFSRLDINPSYLDLYQKIRYGDKNLTLKEKERLIHLLDELMTKIKNKR